MATCLPPQNGRPLGMTSILALVICLCHNVEIAKQLILLRTSACFAADSGHAHLCRGPSRLVMADFGQSDFGQPSLASPFWRPSLAKPTLASVSVLVVWPTLAKTDFGQNRLWPNRLWPNRLWPNRLWPNRLWPNRVRLEFVCVFVCVCCVAWVLVSRFWFGHVGPGTALPENRPSPGPPFPWTTQNFALFFPAAKFVHFFPLWGSSR